MNTVKIYKPKKQFLWAVLVIFLIVFFGLTLPRLIDGTLDSQRIQGLALFYLLILILFLAPFLSRLEIGKDYIKTFLLGIPLSKIAASDVLSIDYGNLMRFGGLGYGKGIKIWVKKKNGGKQYYDLGEKFYGKEAIAHAKRVLESKS